MGLGLHSDDAAAWLVSFRDGVASTIAIDDGGHAVAGGHVRDGIFRDVFDGLVIKLSVATGAEAWRRVMPGGTIGHLILDGAHDVIATGTERDGGTVLKLSGADGSQLWRYLLPGGRLDEVAIDSHGDVVAVGTVRIPVTASTSAFVVLMLDGVDGSERWRRQLAPGELGIDGALGVAIDQQDDVVACGDTTPTAGRPTAFTVLKLSGDAGAVLWHRKLRGSGRGRDGCDAVTVDRAGNVIAAGRMVNQEAENDFTVIKLDGGTGRSVWRRVVIGRTSRQRARARAVAIGPRGEIVAAGSISNRTSGADFGVVKLTAATGLERWRRTIHGSAHESLRDPPFPSEGAWALAFDANGDIVAAGLLRAAGGMSFAVTKLARSTGKARWTRIVGDGAGVGTNLALAVAVAPTGAILAAGRLGGVASSDFAVVQLDGTSGELTP